MGRVRVRTDFAFGVRVTVVLRVRLRVTPRDTMFITFVGSLECAHPSQSMLTAQG
jgi:hypothetical protein